METAIRWSPSATTLQQRFLVADVNGRSFTHCRVESYDGKDLRFKTISTLHKVPAFRAFDWSPHDESIVAVGQWSGEATVLRIDDSTQSVSLPIKHQRLCNAVIFSKAGRLATGLERVRNDFCLNVWDISQRLSTGASPGLGSGRQYLEPIRKLASSEAITSIKFFPSQPDVLVCGVKGACIRIYDIRENTGASALQFQTSCVHNIAIDPLDENYFASAGPPKDPMIHVWDRRIGPQSSAATLGLGSSQNQYGPMVEYRKAFDNSNSTAQPSIWSLRYCKGQSGCLGALASTGDYKIFETKKEYIPELARSKGYDNMTSDGPFSAAHQIFTKRIHQVEHAFDHVRYRRAENKRIVSFDFTNLAGSKGRPCAITLRGDQTIDIYELKGPPLALSVSALSSLAISKNADNVAVAFHDNEDLSGRVDTLFPQEHLSAAISLRRIRANLNMRGPANVRQIKPPEPANRESDPGADEKLHLSSREAHEALYDYQSADRKPDMQDALNLFSIPRRRATQGYLFDCPKNVDIVTGDPWLQDLWTWIGRAKSNAEDESMVAEGIDLSYIGVFGIWNNDLGAQKNARRISKLGTNIDVSSAVRALCDRLRLPESSPQETAYPKHRQLSLYTCGLGLPRQQLEETVKDLVRQGQNTKAAALAVIHDQPKLAFLALRNGSASPAHRELSLALAGFVKGNTDDTWDETVRDVAKELDDPYARAILALVSYGDWHDVLAETSLPLRDRVGVALMYLDDQELTEYIATVTADSIEHGAIEGIVLTGLTEQSIPLWQTYAMKFSDVQTPLLALSHSSPRYFTHPLIDHWRHSYRAFLNSTRLFLPRVQFDVQSTKLSIPPNRQKPLLPPHPRQVSLRCNNCDQALDRNPENNPSPADPSPAAGITNHGSIFGDPRSGTVCPRCGRHMPRCVICMLWLGMPDPSSKGGAALSAAAGGGKKRDPLQDFVAVCRGCWHMSHGGHAEEWFRDHAVCAVPGCECRCGEVDGGIGAGRW